jgi:hypothetical protein
MALGKPQKKKTVRKEYEIKNIIQRQRHGIDKPLNRISND